MGIEIHKTATMNVSADRLWTILAEEFDSVGEWARAVDSSAPRLDVDTPEGASVGGRVCQVPGFGAVNETFTSYDAEARTFSFAATASKIPSFVRNIINHTEVTSIGPDKSQVRLGITADTDGVRGAFVKPMMTRKFNKVIDGSLEDLATYAETGEISSAKSKALAKAG